MIRSTRALLASITLAALALAAAVPALAQDPRPGEPGHLAPPEPPGPGVPVQSSPFAAPEPDDQTFVVDAGPGLDTGCTFRGGGPLLFTIEVGRVVGDVAALKANDMISDEAVLRMPAFDVDFDANIPGIAPERDRVSFNGNVVPTEWLTGSNNVWKLNGFNVPIEWVEFPADPGSGGSVQPAANTVRIDIDTANVGSGEFWCTAIDWAALSIEVADPVVMAHGILSSGAVWSGTWVPNLNQLGLPNSNDLDMGNLDGIGSNAGKIAAEVSASKDRWGVDQVVLVTHSKGGLDSRHFVEDSEDASQLVQIGTPNAGSPLADAAQIGALRLVGPLGTVIINVLAGPAGVQLTTPYMRTYNLFHGSNPKVRYTALAGDYDPDCFFLNPFCRPLERVLLAITGRGDTIVPITSVHALGFTQNRTFGSSGANKEATHTGLPQSTAVFNALSDRVREVGFAGSGQPLEPLPLFGQTAAVLDLIAQGQTQEHPLPIDQQTQVFIPLFYPSGDLDLVLVSPSGQVIDPAAADADPDIAFDSGEVLGGLLEVYNLGAPEVGVWTVRVSAPSVVEPSGQVGYSVAAWLEAPAITFSAAVAPEAVSAGTPLTLLGTLLESGAPLTGATVEATVALPDDSRQTVTLTDDGLGGDVTAGDGVYTAAFGATAQPGHYRVALTAGGTGGAGAAFSREGFALATVSASSSDFAGVFRDFGVDTNGNGLFDQLVVEVDLDVTAEADYRVFGVLEDAAGNTHQANVLTALTPGARTVALAFDGESFFQNGVDGPYTLSVVRLAEETAVGLLPLAERADAHVTAAYGFDEFEHAPIVLTGNGTSTGRDVDGNGKFDFLDVTVEVRVDNAGFYDWSARLLDADGTEIGFDAGSAFFPAGVNSLALTYDGEPIGANGVDGPYIVGDLLLFGGGTSLVATRAFATDAFAASQFEGFVGDTTPPDLEVTLEPSMLWPPNHRMVEVEATIVVVDDIDPTPEIVLVSITSNEPDDGTGDGDTANDIQDADFGTDDRVFSLRSERSGEGTGRVYTVVYRAVDDAGNTTEVETTVVVPHDRGN